MFSINEKFLAELKLWLLALTMSLALWYVVVGNASIESSLTIPIEYRNLPKNFVVVGDTVQNIEVEVLSTSELYDSLKNKNLNYRADLSEVVNGANVIPIDISSIIEGVDILKVSPEYVVVEVDTITKKSVPVHVNFAMNNNDDLQISNVVISPVSVEISGPSTLLREVKSIDVPFDINMVDDEGYYSRTLQLMAPDGLSLSVPVITLSFDVFTEKAFIEVNKLVNLENMPDGYKVNPKSVELALEVAASKVIDDVLDPSLNSQIKVIVNGFRDIADGMILSVQINLPKNIKVLSTNPPFVTIEAEKIEENR